MKKCVKCKIKKDENEFYKCKSSKDGLYSYCKSCKSIDDKKYSMNNGDKINANQKKRRKRNIKKKLLKERQYRVEHRDIMNENNRRWKSKNKEYDKNYYSENKEIIKERSHKWSKDNRDKVNRRYNKRIKTDELFNLYNKIRINILMAIKRKSKKSTTLDLLGCSIEELKYHLESTFKSGMTWKNHGVYGWHIDHKKPCASFDLTKLSEQKRCFHYTNLQALWAKDNLSKGAKIIHK